MTTLVSQADIARRAQVKLPAVSNWVRRHADFPAPVQMVGGRALFTADQIASWLDSRRVPRDALLGTEQSGTTYGQRFRAAGDAPAGSQRHEDREQHPADRLGRTVAALLQTRAARTDPTSYRKCLLDTIADVGDEPRPVGEAEREILSVLHDHGVVDRATMPQLFGRVIDEFQLRDKRRSSDPVTPSSLTDLVGLMSPETARSAYDPYCRTGELLAAVVARRESCREVAAYSPPPHTTDIARQRLGLYRVKLADCGPHPLADRSGPYDVVVSNPPFNAPTSMFGRTTWPLGRPPDHNGNVGWLQHIWESLVAKGGRGFVVMPNTVAVSANDADLHVRAELVQRGSVECIVALPSRLFPDTGAQVMLWVLRREKDDRTLFIDATEQARRAGRRVELSAPGRIAQRYWSWREGGELDVDVPCREVTADQIIAAGHSLDPRRYVTIGSDADPGTADLAGAFATFERARRMAADIGARRAPSLPDAVPPRRHRTVPLRELCAIQPGPSGGTLREDPTGAVRVRLLRPRDLGDGAIAAAPTELRIGYQPNTDRYALRSGDLVGVRTGEVGAFALADSAVDGAILATSLVRFRVEDDAIDPRYLLRYLLLPDVTRWLRRNSTGTTVRTINTARLGELMVAVPSPTEQRRIVADIDQVQRELDAHRAAASAARRARDALSAAMIPAFPDGVSANRRKGPC
ncbi:N-6 DNA methylase [Actinocatenispora comari]|uniref:Uncharacterized protein n=1 Tax=Actinocatenispora comari TaxID=2807577 RepID=A0A8J4EL79_9ACTN|nr:N-6 DNA methylase [Actinocatenispora comari]GIL28206.1 hypothetical protein NUM_34600 [Actinocatenispora comari]